MTMDLERLYAEHRQFLWGLCYRMTGSAADADDVVQDTFVRAIQRPPKRLDEPLRPWLVKVAINLTRDLLRRRRRQAYVGPWLPSPVDTGTVSAPPSHEPAVDGARTLEGRYDLLESVTFAFLVALERLTPTQRAVLLLRDVFDYSVREAAHALDRSEANVRTSHHRARRLMQNYDRAPQVPTAAVQESTRTALVAFLRCLEQHDVAGVEALLAEDVRTVTDGGGEFLAARRLIDGRDKVAAFYVRIAEAGRDTEVRFAVLNGLPSLVGSLRSPTPQQPPRYVVQVELDRAGRIAQIYMVSATRKLTALP